MSDNARKRRSLIRRDGMVCGICNKSMLEKQKTAIDHIVPASIGGSNRLKNLRLVHQKCNSWKNHSSDQHLNGSRKKSKET